MSQAEKPHPSDPAYDELQEGEVRASEQLAEHHIDREDPLMDEFFRHPDKQMIDVWEETHPPRAMSHGSRRAMYASIGIFAVSLTFIAGYTAYHTLIMPAPVELGVASGQEPAAVLPTPLTAAPPEAVAHPAEPAATETQLSAASVPPTYSAPLAPTLAVIAAREPSAEAKATGATLDGVVGAHLLGSAAAERDTSEQVAAKPQAALDVIEAQARAEDPIPAIRTGSGAASPPTYDELVAVGQLLSKKNRRIEASEAFRRALLHAPQGSAALSGLSFVYLNAEQNQQAREYAQRAVQADATNAEGWIVLGAALELLGDKLAAQDAYQNCVTQGRGPYLSQCRQVARP